jgi:ElaA protein
MTALQQSQMNTELNFTHKPFAELTLDELYDLLWLRDVVFVVGQGITAESEVDGYDRQCTHVIGRDASGKIVATARIFMAKEPVKVGRVAVHTDLQRSGLGSALMAYVNDIIGDRPAAMSAQAHLEAWYTRVGWQREGDVYEEANILHLKMTRNIG